MQKILITGASGFIGSFLVEHALAAGFEVWAAVRPTSSRRYLSDPRIRFIELDLGSEERLRRQVADHLAAEGAWHHVIHAAGATKCRRPEDFDAANAGGTLRLARTLTSLGALTGRFVFISSLSVAGPIHESDGGPILPSDPPRPNTAYGRSKLAAERGLADIPGLDYIVLRPTGVYGPRERDYFLMTKSIARHIDFAAGFRRQRLTFIYVKDLAEAALAATRRGVTGQAYFLTDGHDYSSRAFSDLLQAELGIRRVLHITAPLWFLRAVCTVSGAWARLCGTASTLNTDKYKIMKQRNWLCDITAARRDLGFRPAYTLERG